MENNYYTILDIQILTGYDKDKVSQLIKLLNQELNEKFKNKNIKPMIYDNKILKDYFLRREWSE